MKIGLKIKLYVLAPALLATVVLVAAIRLIEALCKLTGEDTYAAGVIGCFAALGLSELVRVLLTKWMDRRRERARAKAAAAVTKSSPL